MSASTTHTTHTTHAANDTNTAQFLAPRDPPKARPGNCVG